MHEYRLYSQIPGPRKTQVLHILAGVTASQPVPTTRQTLIYRQLKAEPAPAAAKKGGQARPAEQQQQQQQQQQRLNFVKLVRDCESGVDGEWRRRDEGLPDPAAKTVTSQAAEERELDADEREKFRPGSESYAFVAQYAARGVRFVQQNLVIHVARLYAITSPSAGVEAWDAPMLPGLGDGELVDASGAWVVEVCVRVDDGGNTGLRDRAVKELEAFKRELEGAVDLRVPDRLSLDPRVR